MNMRFDKGSIKKGVLYNVLYVPKLTCNLFSVRAAIAKGNVLKFDRNKCWIRDSKGVLRGLGTLVRKMYQLDCEVSTSSQTSVTVGKDREEATLKIRGYSDPIKAKIEKGEQLESETVEDVIKE